MSEAAAHILSGAAPRVPAGRVVVALSGGPDSAVVAWVACHTDPPREVSAIFVDHGWPASGEMRTAAKSVAEALDIELREVWVERTDSETGARVARLDVLAEAARGAPVLTGHHRDDLAETMVVNLLRGTGATGLSGIPERREPFVRPLLGFTRAEVRAAAEELALPFADDPANVDPRHLRSRVRTEVMPSLDALAPDVAARLARTAALVATDDAVLEEIAASFPLEREPAAVRIPVGALVTQPRAVTARIVRRALRLLHPPYPGTSADVARVLGAVAGPPSELTGGLRAEREGASVVVSDPAAAPAPPAPTTLRAGATVVFGPCVLRLQQREASSADVRFGRRLALSVDAGPDLRVRPAVSGERIDIRGGSKLLRDAMAEAGVPRRLRPSWPVIEGRGRIAAVAGARVAEWARPPAATRTVLELITERTS